MKPERSLVTGGGGFMGGAYMAAMRERGHEVLGLDRVGGEGVLQCDSKVEP